MHLPCRIHSSASYSAPHGTRACKMLRPPALFLGMILLFGSGVSSLAAAKHQSTDVKASTAAISPQFSQPQSAPFGWDTASFLGGSGDEFIVAIARDPAGYLYVGGGTNSPDFPVTAGAYNTQFQGNAGQGSVPFAASPPDSSSSS